MATEITGIKPEVLSEEVSRAENVLKLFEKFLLVNTVEQVSRSFICAPYRKFVLYLDIDSTGAPTTIQIKVQFLNPVTGLWHDYPQGLFASLFYEDVDTASGLRESFSGLCAGREFRITLTGVGTTSSAYFKVNAEVDFMN